MWLRPSTVFKAVKALHTAPAASRHRAETIAAQVPLKETIYFTTVYRQIRQAPADGGVAG